MFKYKSNIVVLLRKQIQPMMRLLAQVFFETVLMIQCLYPFILNCVPTTYNIKDTLRLLIPRC